VRFEGFGADEDEWVNVKKFIRQRSIPLESSQCKSVVEGDLVLCFRVSVVIAAACIRSYVVPFVTLI
jgi:hypothetical protein